MTELADRLSRHADLHEHQPWADDEQMQFARDLREAVGLIAELARLRAQEPEYWQWRRKRDPWEIGKTFNSQVYATTADSEVRCLYAAPPAQPAEPVQRLSDSGLRDKIHDALASELSWCAYDCTRVWEAWSVGTMTQDDFTPVDERLGDIVSTVLSAIESALQPGWRDDLVNGLMGSTISETCRADAAEAAIESIADLLDSHNDDMHSVYGCRPVEKVAKARAIAIAAMLEAAPKATK